MTTRCPLGGYDFRSRAASPHLCRFCLLPSIHSVLVLRGCSRPHLDAHLLAGPTPEQDGFAGVLRDVEEEVQVRHLPRRQRAPRPSPILLTPAVLVAPRVGRPEPAVMSAQPELVLAEH